MYINRKQVVNSFLDNLYRISNQEYQKRVWIEGKGPEVHDFDEAVCDFFDDGDPMLKDYQAYGVTHAQYLVLKEFRDQFQQFADDNYAAEDFIDTPEWARVMDMAKDVLKAFNYPKVNDK